MNVSSVAARLAQPYATAYSAAKAGVAAFTDALRDELVDTPAIQVCTIYPASVDTPFFQHAADFMGKEVKPMPPVYPATDVARAIVGCAEKPKAEVWVGMTPRKMRAEKALMPKRLEEKAMRRQVMTGHFSDVEHGPDHGILFQPDPYRTTVSGGWKPSAGGMKGRVITGALAGAGIAAVLSGAAWLMGRRRARMITRMT